MAENSKIEWTDHTFNAWRGCSKVHEGCAHCYAETLSGRNPGTLGIWGPNGTRVVASEAHWKLPVKWNETPLMACADCGQISEGERIKGGDFTGRSWDFECRGCYGSKYKPVRPRVFCASLADVFEDWSGNLCNSRGEKMQVSNVLAGPPWTTGQSNLCRKVTLDDVRRRLFKLIDATPNLDWLLLTKRPENVLRMWPKPVNAHSRGSIEQIYRDSGMRRLFGADSRGREEADDAGIRPNVWLGTSVSLQEHADKQIPELLKCRNLAANLFLSIEPLLGPVILQPWMDATGAVRLSQGIDLDWIIVGGESGPKARPMHPDWVRTIRDQCQAAGVPFFFKQWGEWYPCAASPASAKKTASIDDQQFVMFGKKLAGRTLDGREWSEFPESTPSTSESR